MKGKIEWKVNEPKEFTFNGNKYTSVECSSGEACLKCDIGCKTCAYHKREIPCCDGFWRADGKEVYFKKI